MTRYILTCTLGVVASVALAGDGKDFQALPIKFPANEISLQDAIAALEKQSGNQVIDRRKVHLSNPKLMLKTTSFWETLDTLGKEQGIGFSPYHVDGAVALVDAPYRKLTTHYSGPFRFAVKRASVTRDDETQTHYVQLALEVAWEPRFQPLFLSFDQGSVVFGKAKQSLERQPMKSVAGTGATELDLRMAAPDRKELKIANITGSLRVIAAPKMLQFKFDKLKAMSPDAARDAETQEGVKVRLLEVKQAQAGVPWRVKMLVVYPEDAIVPLESYQAWYSNNRIWLSWAGRTLEGNEQYESTKEGTRITMTFAPSEATPLPPANANVTLHLRTPSRLAVVTVPFEFRDLPLP